MGDLNETLFLALNASADASPLTVALAIGAAKYLVLVIPALLLIGWLGGGARQRFVALAGLAALLIAMSLNQLVGMVAYSPRPFVLGLGHTLIDHRPSSSFPSNHATVCFTLAAVLAIYAEFSLAWAIAGLGAVVAWSRVYLGIHFPLDMLGAAASACLSALVGSWLMARWGLGLLHGAEELYRLVFGSLIQRGWLPRSSPPQSRRMSGLPRSWRPRGL